MPTPQGEPQIGLWRRISDSEAYILIAESWRQFVLLLAVAALVLWVVFENERMLRAGMALSAVLVLGVVIEWWSDRLRPLPKPKPPPPGE